MYFYNFYPSGSFKPIPVYTRKYSENKNIYTSFWLCLKYKIPKIKPLFKKGSNTSAENYRSISLLPLISKKNQFTIKHRIIFQEMNYCAFIIQALEQIILQIHVYFG